MRFSRSVVFGLALMAIPVGCRAGSLLDDLKRLAGDLTSRLPLVGPASPVAPGESPSPSAAGFLAGVNYPWRNYGTDFGANAWGHAGVSENRADVARDFAFLRSKGVSTVRWFLFCDGRAGLVFDGNGRVTGLDDYFYRDLDAALSVAQDNGIRLILVLFDFHFLDPPKIVGGARLGGGAGLINDPAAGGTLFDNVLTPLFNKYGAHPAVLAWEVINEPEWRVKTGSNSPADATVDSAAMRSFAARVASVIHASGGRATLGSARRSDVAQWRGIGLDLYEFHYYDYMEKNDKLDVPYGTLGLDKPCLLGEFPTKGTGRDVTDYLELMRRDGYAGALGWSLRAGDPYSDFASVADRLAGWVGGKLK